MDRPKADSVLLFSGLDPSGAAGISADIETINQFGLNPLPIVTSLTAQNTQRVESIDVVKDSFLEKQFNLLDEDISFNTVKIISLSCVVCAIVKSSLLIDIVTSEPAPIVNPVSFKIPNDPVDVSFESDLK